MIRREVRRFGEIYDLDGRDVVLRPAIGSRLDDGHPKSVTHGTLVAHADYALYDLDEEKPYELVVAITRDGKGIGVIRIEDPIVSFAFADERTIEAKVRGVIGQREPQPRTFRLADLLPFPFEQLPVAGWMRKTRWDLAGLELEEQPSTPAFSGGQVLASNGDRAVVFVGDYVTLTTFVWTPRTDARFPLEIGHGNYKSGTYRFADDLIILGIDACRRDELRRAIRVGAFDLRDNRLLWKHMIESRKDAKGSISCDAIAVDPRRELVAVSRQHHGSDILLMRLSDGVVVDTLEGFDDARAITFSQDGTELLVAYDWLAIRSFRIRDA